MVTEFGTQTFEFLSDNHKVLEFLTAHHQEDLYASVVEAWALARTSFELSEFFLDKDVTSIHIQSVFETFGTDAKKIIEENPYELVRAPAFTFAKVDDIAMRMKVSDRDPRRYEGAVYWVLREASQGGHLCVRRGDIASQLEALSRNSDVVGFGYDLQDQIAQAVVRMEARKSVMVDTEVGVYLPQHFRFERDSARLLADFITPMKLDVDLSEFIKSYEASNLIELSDAQRDAALKLVSNKVVVVTGLPGTGKTTVVKTLVGLLKQANLSTALMAPTGIAAKRLSSVTGCEASTIHRALRFDGDEWGYGPENKYPIQALIVDEMSMVDQELFYRIVSALDPSTVLIFVGDDAQLPSVGPGSVLRELISCDFVPTVRLTQIFRQKETSDIVVNSHRINRGEALLTKGPESDFQFIPISDEAKILSLIVQMALRLKAKDANFQVLAPKYDGVVGVDSLNEALREALNPPESGKVEFSSGKLRIRTGDRVMVIKNDYKLNIYNGDMGKLVSLNSESLVIRIHNGGEGGLDMMVEIPRKEALQKLRLAYAITVHKSQGSEFDTVVLPIVKTQGRMLQRNLFYTAVTRAKKKVWILGEGSAAAKAIANDKVVLRNTGFSKSITNSMLALRSGVEE